MVDSRTGVTEHGGICTHHLADIVVLITAANPLKLEGAKQMATAKCIIVVWSHESVSSEFVLAEADVALERATLIPVLKESVKPSFAFRQIKSATMTNWDGDPKDRQFTSLMLSIEALTGSIPETKPELAPEAGTPVVGKIYFS